MKNSWILPTLSKDSKKLRYIYLCKCSCEFAKKSLHDSVCPKCANKQFIDINQLEKTSCELEFEVKDYEKDNKLFVEFYFEKPLIDAKTNQVKMIDYTFYQMSVNLKTRAMKLEKSDDKILYLKKVYKGSLKTIDYIIQQEMVFVMLKSFFIPKFDKCGITYHFPKEASADLVLKLIALYKQECKKNGMEF